MTQWLRCQVCSCPSYFLSKFITTSLIYNQEWLLECSDCEICDVPLLPIKEEDSVTTFAQLWYPKSQFFFQWRWNTHKGSAQFFQWKESELIKFLFISYSLCSWKMRKNIYIEKQEIQKYGALTIPPTLFWAYLLCVDFIFGLAAT